MMDEDRNQTVANTVVDYRLSVQRDILLGPRGSLGFPADFAVHPDFRCTLAAPFPRTFDGFGKANH